MRTILITRKTMPIRTLFFVLLVAFALCSCGEEEPQKKEDDPEEENSPPTKPVAIKPADKSKDVILNDTLFWQPSTDKNNDEIKYTVYLDTDNSFPNPLVVENLTETTYTPSEQKLGITYHWKVVASDGKAETPSDVFTYRTRDFLPVSKPVNPKPVHESEGVSLDAILSWDASTNGSNNIIFYDVYWDTENPPKKIVKEKQIETTYKPSEQKSGTTYYWKVVAYDPFLSSAASEIFRYQYGDENTSLDKEKTSTKGEVEMVLVERGSFDMGNDFDGGDFESPVRSVTLTKHYYIGKYEVTHAQYIKFLNDSLASNRADANGDYNGTRYIDINNEECAIKKYPDSIFYFKETNAAKTVNTPVTYVTWDGAKAFCEWAGGRLPTEAEWEYAARGGLKTKSYTYAGSNNLDEVAWHRENAYNLDAVHANYGTNRVGQKEANELGIYDMAGNVWEWVSDWHQFYDKNQKIDPKGPSFGKLRVLRGGSWRSQTSNCRVTTREKEFPHTNGDYYGFRLVVPTE